MRRLAVVPLAVALCACASRPPAPASAPHIMLGRSASFTLPAMTGANVTVPIQGAAATIVDFWATDCEPCKTEVPHLAQHAALLRRDGVRLALVGVLREDESAESARATLRSWGVAADSLLDRGGAIQRRLNVEKIPATLVLDPDGTVRWVAPAGATPDDVENAALEVASRAR